MMTLDAEERARISSPATDRDWLDVRLRVHVGAWLGMLRLLQWLRGGVELVDVE
jgi:hypothetical protein